MQSDLMPILIMLLVAGILTLLALGINTLITETKQRKQKAKFNDRWPGFNSPKAEAMGAKWGLFIGNQYTDICGTEWRCAGISVVLGSGFSPIGHMVGTPYIEGEVPKLYSAYYMPELGLLRFGDCTVPVSTETAPYLDIESLPHEERIRLWCLALRSGLWAQVRDGARTVEGFDPFGVLADLLDPTDWDSQPHGHYSSFHWNGDPACWLCDNPRIIRAAGFADFMGKYRIEFSDDETGWPASECHSIVNDNDDEGMPFSHIADILEEGPPRLYQDSQPSEEMVEEEVVV